MMRYIKKALVGSFAGVVTKFFENVLIFIIIICLFCVASMQWLADRMLAIGSFMDPE